MKIKVKIISSLIISLVLTGCSSDENGISDNGENNSKNEQTTENNANGHEYVDLGLSVKWAKCNVGANSPGEPGNLYAWGETEPKSDVLKDYNINNYKYYNKEDGFTKYCTDESTGIVDGLTRLELEDDVAHKEMGGNWRMPTRAEIQELIDKCTFSESEYEGVAGILITSENGNSIFIPSHTISGWENSWDDYGGFWSADLYEGYNDGRRTNLAIEFDFNTNVTGSFIREIWKESRYKGYACRGVIE